MMQLDVQFMCTHTCILFFMCSQVLLRSDKGDANFSDRTLLKNLGHWLGMLTLAKNKPILQIVGLSINLSFALY